METIDKRDILKLKPFDTKEYEGLPLTSLAAFCIFWLDEWDIPTSLENIAVMGLKLFPAKFAMVGWPEFPDLNRINRAVLNMRPKYRNLATSASDKGVFLSEAGFREARSLIKKLGLPHIQGKALVLRGAPLVQAERGLGKPRSVHPEDAIEAVRKSELFALHREGKFEESEAIDLIGMLGVYDHTPPSEKRRKLKDLIKCAKEIEDKDVADFLLAAQERFIKYLNK